MGIRLLSQTDVITNSSDETYIIRGTHDIQGLTDTLCELTKDLGCSGMGGIIDIADSEHMEGYEYQEEFESWFPAGYTLLTIDYGYTQEVLKYLKEHFEFIEESWDEVYVFKKEKLLERYEELSDLLGKAKSQGEVDEIFPEWSSIQEELIKEGWL